jgi:hypothetical protein
LPLFAGQALPAMLAAMDPLAKVQLELKKYLHPLLDFSVRDNDGAVELVIDLKHKPPGIHTYYLPLHPRDLESAQFPWTLQRLIFDGLHDYFIEMFVYTPQSRDNPDSPV